MATNVVENKQHEGKGIFLYIGSGPDAPLVSCWNDINYSGTNATQDITNMCSQGQTEKIKTVSDFNIAVSGHVVKGDPALLKVWDKFSNEGVVYVQFNMPMNNKVYIAKVIITAFNQSNTAYQSAAYDFTLEQAGPIVEYDQFQLG